MDFFLTDIDQTTWKIRAMEEALLIKENKSFQMSGRSFDNLIWRCEQGQAAEIFLLEHCGYTNDSRPYQDVIDPEDNPVAVKVCKEQYLESNLEDWAYDKRMNPWKEWPNILQVWSNESNKESFIDEYYKYLGKYKWNVWQWEKYV